MAVLSAGIEVSRRPLSPAQVRERVLRRERRAEMSLALGWSLVAVAVAAVMALAVGPGPVAALIAALVLAGVIIGPTLVFRRKTTGAVLLSARVRASSALVVATYRGRAIGYLFADAGDPRRVLFVRDSTLAGRRDFPNNDFTVEYLIDADASFERRALVLKGRKLSAPAVLIREPIDEKTLPPQLAVLDGPLHRAAAALGLE